jgi:hypothetical protein
MNKFFQRLWMRSLVILMVGITAIGWGTLYSSPASARVVHERLQDGRILDKSFRMLTDSNGYSWQFIAFTTTQNGVTDGPYLRLVGFPGAVSVDRDRPMVLSIPSRNMLMLEDVSFLIFKDGLPPQQNVAQYDIGMVLKTLTSPTSLRLTIPVFKPLRASAPSSANGSQDFSQGFSQDVDQLEFRVSKSIVEEWITVAQHPPNVRLGSPQSLF